MFKKTSAAGGLAIAAAAAGIMLTSGPASAQVPAYHHGHRIINRNVNVNRVVVRLRIHNNNNNVAVANNDGFRRHRFFGRDGFGGDGFDGDGFLGGGLGGGGLGGGFFGGRRFNDGAVVRVGDIFAAAD